MFCFHKYDKVQEDGYQYCRSCGVAIVAPCIHDWKRVTIMKYFDRDAIGHLCKEAPTGFAYVYECQKCKAIREEEI